MTKNDKYIADVIYGGMTAAFELTPSIFKNVERVKDHPRVRGCGITEIPELKRKYLRVQALETTRFFKRGANYAFRIEFLNNGKFKLVEVSDKELQRLNEIVSDLTYTF